MRIPIVRILLSGSHVCALVLNVLFARALSEYLPASLPLVVNTVNPGYCFSELRRGITYSQAISFRLMDLAFGRTAEQGARQLVWAALGPDGKEGRHVSWVRGAYVSTQGIKEPSDFVISQDGGRAQEKIWVSFCSCSTLYL